MLFSSMKFPAYFSLLLLLLLLDSLSVVLGAQTPTPPTSPPQTYQQSDLQPQSLLHPRALYTYTARITTSPPVIATYPRVTTTYTRVTAVPTRVTTTHRRVTATWGFEPTPGQTCQWNSVKWYCWDTNKIPDSAAANPSRVPVFIVASLGFLVGVLGFLAF